MLHNRELIYRARELRKNMTSEERRLWYCFLKNYPIKFQTQKVIEDFIVDFYCARAKVIVEIDGSQHYENDELRIEDVIRDKRLQELGYIVFRVDNISINYRFKEICEYIDNIVKKALL